MKKGKKYLIFGLLFAFAILGIVTYLKKKKENASDDDELDIPTPSSSGKSSTPNSPKPKPNAGYKLDKWDDEYSEKKTVSIGSFGKMTRFIQKAINRVRIIDKKPLLSEDGNFGPKTQAGVYAMMGKSSTNYQDIKLVVQRKFAAKGLLDPYKFEAGTSMIYAPAGVMASIYGTVNKAT